MLNSFRGWGNCEVCGKAIRSPAKAAVSVCYKRLAAYEEALDAWKAEHIEVFDDGAEMIRSFEGHPDLVEWTVTHAACACPVCLGDCGGYWFYCTRFENLGKVVVWTLHLMEKRWFRSTDWEGLVRRLYALPAT